MTVELNHTIVATHDKSVAAPFLADILGLAEPKPFGPFLGVFLQSHDWSPSEIGIVMAAGGIAAVVATTPSGLLVDATRFKRALLIAAAGAIVVASIINYVAPNIVVTAVAQIVSGTAGAMIPG